MRLRCDRSVNSTSATLKRRGSMSASGLLSDVSTNVLNYTEGAHLENMSTFEADEHFQELTPLPSAEVESAGGPHVTKCVTKPL